MITIIKGINKRELRDLVDEMKVLHTDALVHCNIDEENEAYWRGKAQTFDRCMRMVEKVIDSK